MSTLATYVALRDRLLEELRKERKRAENAEQNLHRVQAHLQFLVAERDSLTAELARLRACATCDGLGFQSGAHTEQVNDCPACTGTGYEAELA